MGLDLGVCMYTQFRTCFESVRLVLPVATITTTWWNWNGSLALITLILSLTKFLLKIAGQIHQISICFC